MLTTSEIAVTVTISVLTAAGGFFGVRAALRKNRLKDDKSEKGTKPAGGITDQRKIKGGAPERLQA